MTKEPSFQAPCRVLTFLLTLSFRNTHICFFRTVLVLAIFGYFLLLLDNKLELIKFYTKFYAEQTKFLPSNFICLDFLLCTKPVQRNCLYFFKNLKTQCALRVKFHMTSTSRKSSLPPQNKSPEVFHKRGFLKNFEKFTIRMFLPMQNTTEIL